MLWWQDSKEPTGVADVELRGSQAPPIPARKNIPSPWYYSARILYGHTYYLSIFS